MFGSSGGRRSSWCRVSAPFSQSASRPQLSLGVRRMPRPPFPNSAGDKETLRLMDRNGAAAAARWGEFVVPLFSLENPNKPYVAGCGVKVAINRRRFIFTAAHVADLADLGPLWFGAGGEWYNMSGKCLTTDPPLGKSREADRVDAAVIELSEAAASVMRGPFLSVKSLDINDIGGDEHKYLILGFPATRLEVDRSDASLAPGTLRYIGRDMDDDDYENAGVERFSHVVLDYNKRDAIAASGWMTLPNLNGTSGCGIWRFDSLLNASRAERDRLVAILTEYLRPPRNVAIGIRVSVHIQLIHQQWPELADGLPRPRHLRLAMDSDGTRVTPAVPPNDR
jgi:hypothetical protein